MFDHSFGGHKEIGDSCCQVQKRIGSQRAHELRNGTEDEEVVVDGGKREGEEEVLGFRRVVFAQHHQHLRAIFVICDDAATGTFV